MRAGNIKIIKEKYITIWKLISKYEYEEVFQHRFFINDDIWSLYIEKDGYEYPLNSILNPSLEADFLLEDMNEYIKDKDKLIIIGSGLGYIVDKIFDKYPNKKIVIVENDEEILYRLLNRIDLRDKKYKNIEQIFISDKFGMDILKKYIDKNFGKKIGIIGLPVYDNIFGLEYVKCFDEIRNYVKKYRTNLGANVAYQKRWIVNSIINMKKNLETKSIQGMPIENIKNKNVIIVAAGPSLNYEINNLKKIREENSAIILAVGSAINALIENDIYPHASLTYDPQGTNSMVYEKIVNRGINNVPVIYGSSVGYETIKNYPGELVHMITSQDTLSNYFLRQKNNLDIVYDAPSIAVVTLQWVLKFNPKTVIFVGQNLGYLNNRHYASGIDYAHTMGEEKDGGLKKEILKKAVKTIDVNGNEMLSTEGMMLFKNAIEEIIKRDKNVQFINTTIDGANIEGTEFQYLEKIMNLEFISNDVKNYIFDYDIEKYDVEYIKKRREEFNEAYINYNKSIETIIGIFNEMNCENNPQRVDKLIKEFDKNFEKIISNIFYKIVLRPMNRVSHDLLLKRVSDIKYEKDIHKKTNLVINHFGKYIASLESDVNKFIELIRMMDDELKNYIDKEN